jgi:hypothetical protein
MNELRSTLAKLRVQIDQNKENLKFAKDRIPQKSELRKFVKMIEDYDFFCLMDSYIRIKDGSSNKRITYSFLALDVNKNAIKTFKNEMKKYKIFVFNTQHTIWTVDYSPPFSYKRWLSKLLK